MPNIILSQWDYLANPEVGDIRKSAQLTIIQMEDYRYAIQEEVMFVDGHSEITYTEMFLHNDMRSALKTREQLSNDLLFMGMFDIVSKKGDISKMVPYQKTAGRDFTRKKIEASW